MNRWTIRHLAASALVASALLGLPALGVVLAGQRVSDYLEFPPLTRHVHHAGFSWLAFIGMAIGILIVLLPFDLRVLISRRNLAPFSPRSAFRLPRSAFPLWGWLGLGFGVAAWILAWTRFSWFTPFQHFTFSPLWFAYIIVVNALTYQRTGHCMLKDRPRYLLALFAASAAFWWFFEYLNRFVQNWYYAGIISLTPIEYFVFATLPFSTVLPAVLGTYELLDSLPSSGAGLDGFLRINIRRPKAFAWLVLIAAGAGLLGIGIFPDYLFPLLWVSPLLIIVSLQTIRGRATIFSPVKSGCWRKIYLLAMAAPICGFFWEMWNFFSLAKWKYSVPFVDGFKLFEMPLLGFAGYLPFGLECAVIGELVGAFLLGRQKRNDATSGVTKSRSKEEQGPAQPQPGESEFGTQETRKCCGNEFRPFREFLSSRSCGERPRFASLADIAKYGNTAIVIALCVYFLFIPGLLVVRYVADPALRGPGIPKIAWRLHRSLTHHYEPWARKRIASQKAAHLQLRDVPSTEWPMFGSVYYLWATEALQEAWEKDHSLAPEAPRIYARAAIEAATDLILDPVHHTWVKQHWGDEYLHTQNVFFRTLIMAGMTSHERLVGSGKHLPMLRDQVETLSASLDDSPKGVLEDYPGECYPVDVFAAVACIRRADRLLGTDHSAFAARQLRAFQGEMLDKRGLIPYSVDATTGQHFEPSRGIGNSYILIFAPELYPEQSKPWYDLYEKHFWQERMLAAGFREFPKDLPNKDWTCDVDAGPVINGYGPAANAFGVAAARANGRFDHARTLSAQVLAACWPLPDGGMLGPKILSNIAHAPYLGEACMLFMFTVQPAEGVKTRTGGRLPGLLYVGLLFFLGMGAIVATASVAALHRWRRQRSTVFVPAEKLQFAMWLACLCGAATLTLATHSVLAMICLLSCQFLPRAKRMIAS